MLLNASATRFPAGSIELERHGIAAGQCAHLVERHGAGQRCQILLGGARISHLQPRDEIGQWHCRLCMQQCFTNEAGDRCPNGRGEELCISRSSRSPLLVILARLHYHGNVANSLTCGRGPDRHDHSLRFALAVIEARVHAPGGPA